MKVGTELGGGAEPAITIGDFFDHIDGKLQGHPARVSADHLFGGGRVVVGRAPEPGQGGLPATITMLDKCDEPSIVRSIGADGSVLIRTHNAGAHGVEGRLETPRQTAHFLSYLVGMGLDWRAEPGNLV